MTVIKWLGLGLVALIAVLVINTLRVGSFEPRITTKGPLMVIDTVGANQRLSKALQFRTVSTQSSADFNSEPFQRFNQWLELQYPTVHASAKREFVSQHSLLYTLQGTNPALKPVLFAAHTDVVPALETPDSGWTRPPFSGQISDGYIWGRGAIDDKSSVIGLLEASEQLLRGGFKPERTLYLAFGHDEEIGGRDGALKIAQKLKAEGVQLEFMLDEGGVLTQGMVGGVDYPVANINPAEKGYATFTLSTEDVGGHSSLPPPDTAVSRLARAIVNINEQRLPAEITTPVKDMLTQLAPAMPFGQKLAVANMWLFEPVLLKLFAQKKATAAMTQNTVAPTVFNAGDKENVLPRSASAKINFRLLPGTTRESLAKHLAKVVDDPLVTISIGQFSSDPSPYGSRSNRAWNVLVSATEKHFPSAVITPSLTVGATDARHYVNVSDDQYRFLPIILTPEDITGFHGKNERISIQNWHRLIRWYIDFIQAASKP